MIHNFKDPENRWLSNFVPVIIMYDGAIYQSVEHAYMSAKFDNPHWKTYCRTEPSPGKVKRESYERLAFDVMVENWDVKKLQVMRVCLVQKFAQEPFMTRLLETGDQNIQEGNWHNDIFWGVDLKESPNIGENHLGRMIMDIRTMLQYDRKALDKILRD